MLRAGSVAFVSIPNPDNRRTLVEGKVVSVQHPVAVMELEALPGLSAGDDVTLFADVRGKFHQQAAKVAAINSETGTVQIEAHLIGEPVSAEQRGTFRVSCIALLLPVHVEKLAGCILADVSPEGLGVITPKPLVVGSMVDASLVIDAFKVQGRFKVQTAKILPNGQMRFGLYQPDRRGDTRKTLEKLAGHLQRMQLKRLSGAA